MPAALAKAPKASTTIRAARSGRLLNRPSPSERDRATDRFPGRPARMPMLSCGQAWIQSRQNVQSMLLDFRGWYRWSSHPGMLISAADAVLGPARRTDVRVAHLDFQRRDQRLHEVELADRADVLAEGCAAKEAVDRRRPPRNRPATIQAVHHGLSQRANASYAQRKTDEQDDRQPFVPQPSRPAPALREPAPGERPRHHERAGHAEDVAGREQPRTTRPRQ